MPVYRHKIAWNRMEQNFLYIVKASFLSIILYIIRSSAYKRYGFVTIRLMQVSFLYFCILKIFMKYISLHTGLDKQKMSALNCEYFLPINFNICLGAQKNRLIETVLLSTHNICFG